MYFVVGVLDSGDVLIADSQDLAIEQVSQELFNYYKVKGVEVVSYYDAARNAGLVSDDMIYKSNRTYWRKLLKERNGSVEVANTTFNSLVWKSLVENGLPYHFDSCRVFDYSETAEALGVALSSGFDVIFLRLLDGGQGFAVRLPDWRFGSYPSCSGYAIKHMCELNSLPVPDLRDNELFIFGYSSLGVAKCCSYVTGSVIEIARGLAKPLELRKG